MHKCSKIKSKNCFGLIPEEATPEQWIYWCQLQDHWQLIDCKCKGKKYILNYENNQNPSKGTYIEI